MDGVWISCCVKFLLPLMISCVFRKFDYKLVLLVLSINISFYFKGVFSVVSGVTLKLSLCTEMVAIAGHEISPGTLIIQILLMRPFRVPYIIRFVYQNSFTVCLSSKFFSCFLACEIRSRFCSNYSIVNHARFPCRSILVISDVSLSVSVSRNESGNCEKRFKLCITVAFRDVCGSGI